MKTIPLITEARANKCVTHHYACDCREYKYQQMEKTLKDIHDWIWSNEFDYDDILVTGIMDMVNKTLGK